jgi:hypothetical protein
MSEAPRLQITVHICGAPTKSVAADDKKHTSGRGIAGVTRINNGTYLNLRANSATAAP